MPSRPSNQPVKHFTFPLHKWPLPHSTGCWALRHKCLFPSAASQPWALARHKPPEVARDSSNPLPFGGFHMALLKRHQQARVSLPGFLLYDPVNWKRCPCVSQLLVKRNFSACGMAIVMREQGGARAVQNQHRLSSMSSPGLIWFCHPQWQHMHLHSKRPD